MMNEWMNEWMIQKGSMISLKIGSVVVKDKLNFAIYENSGLFFEKFEKILISSWKLGKLWWNFGNFGSKIQTWRGHFFCSPETWHTCRTWKVKYRNFRVLWFCKKKIGEKSDSSLKLVTKFTDDFYVKNKFHGNPL